jgi:hypothetical protein
LKGVDTSLQKFGFGEIGFFLDHSFLGKYLVIFAALLDYIDLFLIHDPMSGSEKRLQTYKALQECRKAGKIRSVGVSN